MQPAPVHIDADGTKWFDWLYEYDWNGDTFSFSICAPTREDADERLKRLPMARYVGQSDGGPVSLVGGGWLVPLIVWWRNLKQSRHS
jgi:hypothetical protein